MWGGRTNYWGLQHDRLLALDVGYSAVARAGRPGGQGTPETRWRCG